MSMMFLIILNLPHHGDVTFTVPGADMIARNEHTACKTLNNALPPQNAKRPWPPERLANGFVGLFKIATQRASCLSR
jgi:hypothetical protein